MEYASEQRTGERLIRSPVMVRLNSLQLLSLLTTVYNCVRIKLTVPRNGCKLWYMSVIRTTGGSQFIDRWNTPFLCQPIQSCTDLNGVIEHDTIRNNPRILDALLLLFVHIIEDNASEREGDPIFKVVVFFRFIRAAMNHFAQANIRNEFQEEDGALYGPKRMKRLVETIFVTVGGELTHPLQEHLKNLVVGRDGRLVDETHQQGQAFRNGKVPEIRGVQGARLFCQMLHLSRTDAFHQALCIPQRLKPGQTAEPVIQVRQGCTFGRFLDPVERGKVFCGFTLKKLQKRLLFCLDESLAGILGSKNVGTP